MPAWQPPKVVGKVKSTTTHLEMFAPPQGPPLQAPRGAEMVKVLNCRPAFYRFLYNTVGGDWLWTDRRLLSDEELNAILSAPGNDLRILWLHGQPAGYAEFDFADPEDVELTFFGLMPGFIGQGLGKFFIDWSCRHAFFKGARRFWVHTCDLDSPKALGNYERAGFETFEREETFGILVEGVDLPEHARGKEVLPP